MRSELHQCPHRDGIEGAHLRVLEARERSRMLRLDLSKQVEKEKRAHACAHAHTVALPGERGSGMRRIKKRGKVTSIDPHPQSAALPRAVAALPCPSLSSRSHPGPTACN